MSGDLSVLNHFLQLQSTIAIHLEVWIQLFDDWYSVNCSGSVWSSLCSSPSPTNSSKSSLSSLETIHRVHVARTDRSFYNIFRSFPIALVHYSNSRLPHLPELQAYLPGWSRARRAFFVFILVTNLINYGCHSGTQTATVTGPAWPIVYQLIITRLYTAYVICDVKLHCSSFVASFQSCKGISLGFRVPHLDWARFN